MKLKITTGSKLYVSRETWDKCKKHLWSIFVRNCFALFKLIKGLCKMTVTNMDKKVLDITMCTVWFIFAGIFLILHFVNRVPSYLYVSVGMAVAIFLLWVSSKINGTKNIDEAADNSGIANRLSDQQLSMIINDHHTNDANRYDSHFETAKVEQPQYHCCFSIISKY